MRAENFVVVFFLIMVGAYFTYAKHTGSFGNNVSSIEIKDDNLHEEIHYAGSIEFNDREDGFKSISPGGFVNYIKNERRMMATSDKQGLISYEFYNGTEKLQPDSNSQKLVMEATQELIAWGVNAQERMERVYKSGGNRGLMHELATLRNDNTKKLYFQRILDSDSLSEGDLSDLISKISTTLGSDEDKMELLRKIKISMVQSPSTLQAYLKTVEGFGDDNMKTKALEYALQSPAAGQSFPKIMEEADGISDENEKSGLLHGLIVKGGLDDVKIDQVIASIGLLNDENTKGDLLSQIMRNDSLSSRHFDNILVQINRIRDNNEKKDLFLKCLGNKMLTEDQWISLANQTSNIDGEEEKGNYLISLWQKIPKSEKAKAAYLNNAKSIHDDFQYGRVVRMAS